MANNSNRKAIEFMVVSPLPPHSTNVLWMDTSIPGTPVLKIFMDGAWAGIWTTVRTEDERSLELLTKIILEQHGLISELTDEVKVVCDSTNTKVTTLAVTSAKETTSQQILTAVENIDIDTSNLAKEATLGTSSDTSVATTIFGWLKSIRDFLVGIVTTNPYAKEAQVKDGNDTAISVSKEVRSEVGTHNDIAAETGTLAAVLKWVKNKVIDIYNALTDGTNGLAAIKEALPSVSGLAQESSVSTGTGVSQKTTIGELTDNTHGLSALQTVLNSISSTMYKGVPVITPQGSGEQANPYVLQPNQWNQFSSTLSGGDIYFSKGTDIANITNCYMVRFELAASWSGTSVNFEGFSLEWNGGSVPTWTAGNTYEINIVDNIAMWAEIEPTT